LAAKDTLFPPDEVLVTLRSAHIQGIQTIITPGAYHASLALASSKPVIAEAVEKVRQG